MEQESKYESTRFNAKPCGVHRNPNMQKRLAFFCLVAGIIMPGLMVGSLIVYGFVVWFMQIFFFGPPSA